MPRTQRVLSRSCRPARLRCTGWLSAKRVTDCAAVGTAALKYDPLFSGTNGLLDFAGSGVVHMVGGSAALVAALVVGPRLGRYDKRGKAGEFAPSNPAFQALGTFILWLGW